MLAEHGANFSARNNTVRLPHPVVYSTCLTQVGVQGCHEEPGLGIFLGYYEHEPWLQLEIVATAPEGLSGLNHQPSNIIIFYHHPSKMRININCQKVSRYFKSCYFLWSLRASGSWRISKLEKPVGMFSETFSLDITRPYNIKIF